jgi:hypothetical protein
MRKSIWLYLLGFVLLPPASARHPIPKARFRTALSNREQVRFRSL